MIRMLKTYATRCCLLLLLVGTAVVAEEVLSREFLDYLVEFETEEGEWIDPVELELMANLGAAESDAEASSPGQEVEGHE